MSKAMRGKRSQDPSNFLQPQGWLKLHYANNTRLSETYVFELEDKRIGTHSESFLENLFLLVPNNLFIFSGFSLKCPISSLKRWNYTVTHWSFHSSNFLTLGNLHHFYCTHLPLSMQLIQRQAPWCLQKFVSWSIFKDCTRALERESGKLCKIEVSFCFIN